MNINDDRKILYGKWKDPTFPKQNWEWVERQKRKLRNWLHKEWLVTKKGNLYLPIPNYQLVIYTVNAQSN